MWISGWPLWMHISMNEMGDKIVPTATLDADPSTLPFSIAEDLKLSPNQTTLNRSIDCAGVALHSGKKVSLSLLPAEPDTGIVFRRIDLPGKPEIAAKWDNVVDTTMCTTLGDGGEIVISTVEHLMAAISGCHVDNLIVELDGPEVPVMDGSAQPFVFLIECAGVCEQDAPRRIIEILKPVRVEGDDWSATLLPSNSFSVGFEIEFADSAVARQEISITLVNGTFKKEIARARTFGFANEVEQLRAAGLGLGGSLDNAVIVDGGKILNDGGLRYDDEFVRHKVLDAVGDLYLAGGAIRGHYRGVRAGHRVTNTLLRALFADPDAWRYVELSGREETVGRGYTPVYPEVQETLAATA